MAARLQPRKAIPQRTPTRQDRPKLAVSIEALASARIRPAGNAGAGGKVIGLRANNPFAPYDPPRAVIGRGNATKLAMDSAASETIAWALQGVLGQAAREGMQWVGYPELALLSQRPEYRRVSEVISTEMTRKWIRLKSSITPDEEGEEEDGETSLDPSEDKNPKGKKPAPKLGKDFSDPGPDVDDDADQDEDDLAPDPMVQAQKDKARKIKELEDELKRLKVRETFARVALHDGLYGRGHIYIELEPAVDNPPELLTPIGPGNDKMSAAKCGKGQLKALKVIEPVWAYPYQYNSSDPLADDWFKPTTWNVMAKQIHASRFLTIIGREVPDLLKAAYAFGGLSLTQMMRPYVDNWLRTRQSVSDVVYNFSTHTLATDLSSLEGDGSQVENRANHFIATKNNKGLLLIDKGSEEFGNVAVPLGSLDSLQSQAQEHMAAVCGIPIVKLLGIQPSGMNASSEGEIRVFYDWIAAYQQHLFGDALQTIIWFLMLNLWGEIDEEIVYDFVPLYELTEKEHSELRKNDADTDNTYVSMGALDPAEVRKKIAADPDSPYASIDVEDVPDNPMDQMMEQMGDEPGEEGAAGKEGKPKPKGKKKLPFPK